MDLKKLGIENISSGACIGGKKWMDCSNNSVITSFNPTTGNKISDIQLGNADNYDEIIKQSIEAFHDWRMVPAPKRGELIYQIALKLREKKDYLGSLISYEMGKIKTEGDGEVQEMIDLADFAAIVASSDKNLKVLWHHLAGCPPGRNDSKSNQQINATVNDYKEGN